MAVATIVLYEQSALAKHIEAHITSITEEQFEAAKRIMIERGGFVVEGDDKHHRVFSNTSD